jgi:phosphomannomutase
MPIKISADYNKAFKPTDIRGIYPTQIDEEVAYLVGRSFVDEFKHKTVLVARDMRLSTPALHESFCKGVTDAGADVVDIGLVPTPVLYFASATLNLAGVVITASHSPKEYNGLKLVQAGAIPLTETQGLKQIRKRMEKGVFVEVPKPGKIKHKDVLKGYQRFVLKGIKMKGLENIKIVADAGNGMAGVLLPLLQEKLPIKFTTMFTDLDGRFPNRGSDPTLKKHQRQLIANLKEGKNDFGIGFDGDADRIAFLDENGVFINSAAIGALVAKRLLLKNPKAKMVYTCLTSRVYEETILAGGGKAVPAKVGHAFIKQTMRQKDALFGCEHSSHFYFKDYFFTDSVVLTLRYVLEAYLEAKEQGMSFSEMMKPYTIYRQTEDVVIEVSHKVKALKLVDEYLMAKKPLIARRFDGIWVDYGEVWGAAKISVTEEAIKVMFESKVKAKAQKLQDELVDYIKSIAKE